jgi:hypothetical protein
MIGSINLNKERDVLMTSRSTGGWLGTHAERPAYDAQRQQRSRFREEARAQDEIDQNAVIEPRGQRSVASSRA